MSEKIAEQRKVFTDVTIGKVVKGIDPDARKAGSRFDVEEYLFHVEQINPRVILIDMGLSGRVVQGDLDQFVQGQIGRVRLEPYDLTDL